MTVNNHISSLTKTQNTVIHCGLVYCNHETTRSVRGERPAVVTWSVMQSVDGETLACTTLMKTKKKPWCNPREPQK